MRYAMFWAILPALLLTLGASGRGESGDIVINEVLDHSPRGGIDLRYLELFNRGASEVDLSGWSLAGDIRFTFPEKAVLAPGSYLVVCRRKADLVKRYGGDIA